MKFQAKKAVRTKRPLKVSIDGLSGAGKTFTALRLAFDMKRNGIGSKIVVLDSENGSASLYADIEIDGEKWDFQTCDLTPEVCNPAGYTEAYRWAVSEGFDIIIFDSLSHAWHGAIEKVDQIAMARKGDKFQAWATVTPQQREMLQVLTDGRAHLIATMRVKSEYERVQDGGKTTIKKIGTKTDQREGAEYEFDMVLRMDAGNQVTVEKVRGCSQMNGISAHKPGPAFWKPLLDWWQGGAEVPVVQRDLKEEVTATMKAASVMKWSAVIEWINTTRGIDGRLPYALDVKFHDVDPAELRAWVDAMTPR